MSISKSLNVQLWKYRYSSFGTLFRLKQQPQTVSATLSTQNSFSVVLVQHCSPTFSQYLLLFRTGCTVCDCFEVERSVFFVCLETLLLHFTTERFGYFQTWKSSSSSFRLFKVKLTGEPEVGHQVLLAFGTLRAVRLLTENTGCSDS